ncbi:hypothetical protein DM860_009601 [Cuscuta australis]|uniref:Uncharacterized protein n=1 Tax=Cuscuta australis TaxID=267555 RepID=A0A328DJE6_9ASTE|nr:hypothetical protein DM860_009601 [Cuscuta australis]
MRGERSVSAAEGGGSSYVELATIESAAGSMDGAFVFHVVYDIIGFALFMHQQIPSLLQDLTSEFDELLAEFKELEAVLAHEETTGPARRKHASRKREVRVCMRRWNKFMNTISNVKTALQLMLTEVPSIETLLLVIGSTPIRPLHVFELHFSQGGRVRSPDYSRTRAVETILKKAIRELVSRGAGSSSNPGATKLYLLVRAPSSLSLPLHFVPKRDFRFSKKKVEPFKLVFKCKVNGDLGKTPGSADNQDANTMTFTDSAFDDIIWFQCRHVIKGFATRTSPTEED